MAVGSAAGALLTPPMRPLDARHRFVVLHRRERVIEVVQELAPALIRRRTAEALGVILETLPFDEEQIAARALETAP